MSKLSELLRLPERLTRKSAPKPEKLHVTDHFTFEFDAAIITSHGQSRAVEDEDGKFHGEYGTDVIEDGPINILQIWLFDMNTLSTATAFLVTYPTMMNLDESKIEIKKTDKIVLASESQDFELDSYRLHLTGHITTVLHKPDGSLDKITVEVTATTKTPNPQE